MATAVSKTLVACLALSMAACSKACSDTDAQAVKTTAKATETVPKTVTVRAACCSGTSTLHRSTLRRLVAWQKGNVRIGRYGMAGVGLKISEVLEGELYDPKFASRPRGANILEVSVINEANIAVEKLHAHNGKVSGKWKLTELPDGSFLVANLADTPFSPEDITEGKREETDIEAGLNSPDPKQQGLAMQKLEATRCFRFIPRLIDLLESRAIAETPGPLPILPPGMELHLSGPVMIDSTLGEVAQNSLTQLTALFAGRHAPDKNESKASWQKWWQDLLAEDPFPRLQKVAGAEVVLGTLTADPTRDSLAARMLQNARFLHPRSCCRHKGSVSDGELSR